MRGVRFVVVLLIWLVCLTRVAGQSPQTLPLIQAADVTPVGSFTLPDSCGSGVSFFSYGGGGLGMSANGLYVAAYDAGPGQVGEVTIPAMGGRASVRTNCVTVPGISGIGYLPRVGGMLLWNGRVIVSGYSAYDAASPHVQVSHTAFNLGTGQATPFVPVGNLGGGFVGGYMGVVPTEWRTLLGGPALTGESSLSIIERTSSGPAAFAFNPDDVGVRNPVPATPLLYYPLDHPLAGGAANPLYQRSDPIGGMAFPAGTRSVLFVGVHGMGPNCYGESPVPCNDPTSGDKGDHNYPYQYQIWAYDANDLLAVKNKAKQPWELRPYATWKLTGIEDTGRATMRPGGATFDPVTRRLYIAAPKWGSGTPRIYVYQVGKGSTTPPPPDPPPTGDIFEHVETITVPASTVTVPAQTITRTLLCSRSKGTCVVK